MGLVIWCQIQMLSGWLIERYRGKNEKNTTMLNIKCNISKLLLNNPVIFVFVLHSWVVTTITRPIKIATIVNVARFEWV